MTSNDGEVGAASELHLFVLWDKSRFAEKRILEDLRRETEIVATAELAWEEPALDAYRKFYGAALPDAKRKFRRCGAGPFLLVVVRDLVQDGQGGDDPNKINEHVLGLKKRYRAWAGGYYRVHSTTSAREFARDIFLLTGHAAREWETGAPPGPLRPVLPEWWGAISARAPFKIGHNTPGLVPKTENLRVFLESKFLNDAFYTGTVEGIDCIVKHSSVATRSIENEYRLAARAYAQAPEVVAMPVAHWFSSDGNSAYVASEKLAGPSLSDLLVAGVTNDQADGFASDLMKIADALSATGIVHRDIFTDNLLLGSDGHLKLIDWQLAIRRDRRIEDPWVVRHWKFHYVVFGVNRDRPPGHWNDVSALMAVMDLLPQTAKVRAAMDTLAVREKEADLDIRPSIWTRLALKGYAVSLFFQMLVRRKGAKRDKIRRRLLTVLGRGGVDVDGRDPEALNAGKGAP
jgi:hypothetical protein